jgi:UDP-N-acetylmuramate--alanine ligase
MTLKAVRQIEPGRIVVLFQPHRYTRTQHLFTEFMTAFYDADMLVVVDIYPAGEAPLPGVNSERFCESLREYGIKDARYIPDLKSAESYLADFLQPGDVLLTLGAGDVWHSGEAVIKMLGSGKANAEFKK